MTKQYFSILLNRVGVGSLIGMAVLLLLIACPEPKTDDDDDSGKLLAKAVAYKFYYTSVDKDGDAPKDATAVMALAMAENDKSSSNIEGVEAVSAGKEKEVTVKDKAFKRRVVVFMVLMITVINLVFMPLYEDDDRW